MHKRQYLWWIVLAAMCLSLISVCEHGVSQTNTPKTQEDKYHEVLMKKRKSWDRLMPIGKAWPTDDNPWAPFDLTRMFEESDLVVRARVKMCLYVGPNDKIRHLRLVRTVEKIEAVYKGHVQTDIVEWRTNRQLTIQIIVGARHTGHWGYADLQIDRPYILFLKRVPRKELVSCGYENEPGAFYKINRIWHGAIVLSSKKVTPCANSNILRNRTPLRDLGMFWPDFAEAVQEIAAMDKLSRDGLTSLPKARLAAVAYRAKLYEALAASAASGKTEPAGSALDGVPAEVLDGYEGVSVYRALVAEKDPKAHKKFVARIKFLAAMAKDVARFAKRRIKATTRPATGTSTENSPQSKGHDAGESELSVAK